MRTHTGWTITNENEEPVGLTVRGWDFFPHFFFAEKEDAEKFLEYLKILPLEHKNLSICKTTLVMNIEF